MRNENSLSFWRRLLTYQKERFPVLGHGPLILMFTFSAISYSRISRGAYGFIPWQDFLVGFITTFGLFLLLRILDEFKDKDIDATYRSHLPVPRGLVSFKELAWLGGLVLVTHFTLIAVFHARMISFYLIILGYLGLMTAEFFVPAWLKKHIWIYMSSHMLIIPLVDLYASGLDWYLDGSGAHFGLVYFFLVSFLNGMVLEIGRKLKNPKDEKEGVQTYSKDLGYQKAVIVWIALMIITVSVAAGAVHFARLSAISYIVLGFFALINLWLAHQYFQKPSTKNSKRIEYASGIWTLIMYGVLGGLPGLIRIV